MSPRGGCACMLEVLDAREEGSGSRYFRKCLFFPYRPMVGDEIYIDGDALKKAVVAIVDWFVHANEAFMQVRLEANSFSYESVMDLLNHGWAECADASTTSPSATVSTVGGVEPQDKGV